jgi:hypothetical protein
MKIEAVSHRHFPRSMSLGRNPLPVIVAYFDPPLDNRDTQ